MKTKNIILYLVGLLVFCSCQDMFEPADENNRQLDDLTEESKYAHGLLMYAYDRLPYLTTTTTDIATDDAVSNQTKNNNYLDMATGTWASDNDPMSQWNNCKDGIQYVNLFLTIVNQVKWAPSAVSKNQMFVDRLTGEAHALRALFYYYLLQAHGGYADDNVLYGVPLLTLPEDVSSVKITPGKDYVTLVTCTPYGVNTHRLLVRGVRVSDENQVKDKAVQETVKIPAYAAPLGIAAILVMTAVLLVRLFKK